MEKQRQAYFYAAVAVLLWSTVATAFKITLRCTDPMSLVFYASAASTIVLFFNLLLTKKNALLKKITKKDLLRSSLLGLLNPFLYYIILFKAYDLLPAQQAQPLNYLWPIMLVLLSAPLLKQKISLKSFLAILVSFAGAFIISTQGQLLTFKPTNTLGVSLALGSSIFWALYWIYNIKHKNDPAVTLFLNFVFGTAYMLIAMLVFFKFNPLTLSVIIGSIYIGLFEMGITFIVWLKALKLSGKTARIANLVYLAPFLSLIFIHFILAETIHPSTMIGLILIIAGILIQNRLSLKYVQK
ncbi:MAG: DMT family transporter [Planctomycetota bacterium]|jgi:drug/metabolite transporter (DMT)-like permease